MLVCAFERAALLAHHNHGLADHTSVVTWDDGQNRGLPLRELQCEIHLRSVQRVYPVAIGLSEPSVRQSSERTNLRTSLDGAQEFNVGSFVGESGPFWTKANKKSGLDHVDTE